jgi:hypothetical protein
MRPHPTRRRALLLQEGGLLLGCLALLVAGAAPASSAQVSGATGYEVHWTFGSGSESSAGGVVSTLTERSYSFVDDLRDEAQTDRAISKPDRGEHVSINGQPCTPGNYNSSAVAVYGTPDWFNTSSGGVPQQRVRVSLMCKRADGTQHRYQWGYATGSVNCVTLTRTSAGADGPVGDVFTLVAGEGCPVVHSLVSSSGKATTVHDGPVTLTSSIELLSRR